MASKQLNTARENILKVIKYLMEVEDAVPEDVPAKIYVHGEFDSNVTNFEYLSNEDIIGLSSKLDPNDVKISMDLFQKLFDHNYWEMMDIMADFEDSEEISSAESKTFWTPYMLYKAMIAHCITKKEDDPTQLDETDMGENRVNDNVPMVYTYKKLLAIF